MVSQTEEFAALLASLEKEDPAAREVCESYRKEKEELQARRKAARKAAKNDPRSKPTTWREAVEHIRKGNPILPTQRTLWQNLPENDRAEIARLAEEERDPLRRTALFSLLRRFGGEILQSYPRDPSPLIEEMERNASVTLPVTPENRWLWELCRMAAKIRHPAVREAALRMLPRYRDNPASIPYLMAPEACFTNYQPGDEAVLTDFITSVRDEEELHRIGMALIYECEVPLPEAVWLYLFENTTCSSCRTRFFTVLMEPYGEYRNLPAHLALIREEAKLDCDCGTRIIAQGEGIEKKKRL